MPKLFSRIVDLSVLVVRHVGRSGGGAFCFLLLIIAQSGLGQTSTNPAARAWTHLPAAPPEKRTAARWVLPLRGELFQFDAPAFRGRLSKAKLAAPVQAVNLGAEIELPMPDGSTARFKVVEAPVMAPELAAKFPEIKTYAGQGIDDPEATVRLDMTPAGFHAQVLSPRGVVYVDPAYQGDATIHVSYYKRDYRRLADDFQCLTEGGRTAQSAAVASAGVTANKIQSGTTLRTYRLAVACTGEYAAYFGGTVPAAMAAIVTAVNRVDGVYETELAVRLVLIGNDDLLVYTNPATDPYSNTSGNTMLGQNQANIDLVIGSGNYDIGHVFSTGGGGIATVGCVCVDGVKARGVTGLPDPTGDAFYIDFVAHEMGHQFGAHHTFNSQTGNCGGNNRNASTAYEPGSGSTIMAYAGTCQPNDLQSHSDPYFHTASLDEIQTYLSGGGGDCAVNSSTGNSAPTVSAGAAYTIPAATPFMLTASGSDSNGDPLTYCWEERDLGTAAALTDPDNGSSPLFRSFAPTNSPVRYFPRLSSVLAHTNWNQEIMPTTSRTMNFRVTARDNRSGGGGVVDADTTVTVSGAAGPFLVTAPSTSVTWSNVHTVTWNVAGTASAPVSATGVNIYLSTDGGLTFPYLLATNTPNDGSQAVTMPNVVTAHARVKVQGAGNIFYDISPVDFTVQPHGPFPQLAATTLVSESCTPTNGVIDPYEAVTVNWSITNLGPQSTTNLIATLLVSNGVYYPSAAQNYGVIPPGGAVTRPFSFIPAGACGGSVTGVVQLVDGASDMGMLTRTFTLGAIQSTTVTQAFNNASLITINADDVASPYPSTILVAGVTNPVTKVTAALNGFSHPIPDAVFVLLVAPGGQSVVLMSYAGSSATSGANLTFDDAAAGSLPFTGAIPTGSYLPTDYYYSTYGAYDFWPPAPFSPYGTNLVSLGTTPNGLWSLYAFDAGSGSSGSISGGWSLGLITSNSVISCCDTFPAPTFTSTTYSNNMVRFNWNAIPGPHYQVQYRTNLTLGVWQNLGGLIPGTNTTLGITDTVTNTPMRFYRVVVSD